MENNGLTIDNENMNIIVLAPEDFISQESFREGNRYHYKVTIKVDGEERVLVIENQPILTDDNYFVFPNNDPVNRVFYAVPSNLHEGGINASCVGSHGGKNNRCDNCRWNMEHQNNEEPRLNISTDPCTLSKHYFSKEYWFQYRSMESAPIPVTGVH